MRINEKGITLIALVVTVIVVMIINGMIIYKSKDILNIRNIEKLFNDIETISTKVNEYYDEYGTLPIVVKYNNIAMLRNMDSVLNDEEKTYDNFFIIDLEKLKGLTLNYGRDFSSAKKLKENDDMSNYSDIYVVNSITHNVFYVKGIEILQNQDYKKYFTNYTVPDNTKIDLRYIDGILIPDGYSFEKKDDNGNLVIKNNNNSEDYTWVKVISKFDKVPDSITLNSKQNENDFINSVNEHDGYFIKTDDIYRDNGKNIIYL